MALRDQWDYPPISNEPVQVLFGRGDGDLHLDPLILVNRIASAAMIANEGPCKIEININGEIYNNPGVLPDCLD